VNRRIDFASPLETIPSLASLPTDANQGDETQERAGSESPLPMKLSGAQPELYSTDSWKRTSNPSEVGVISHRTLFFEFTPSHHHTSHHHTHHHIIITPTQLFVLRLLLLSVQRTYVGFG